MAAELKTLFSWQAPEYPYHLKGGGWYGVLGILTVILLAAAYLLNNFLFGVLIIIGSFAIALYSARRPKIVTFSLTVQGLQIENRLYPYENIASFWIHYNPPAIKETSIILNKGMISRLSLSLGDADPNDIRDILVKYVSEKSHEESFTDILGRYLRF